MKNTEKTAKPLQSSFFSNVLQLEPLTRITYFMVFISSAFVIHNGITEFKMFTLCFVALLASYFGNQNLQNQEHDKSSETTLKNSLLYFVQLLTVVAFFSLTENIFVTAVFISALFCAFVRTLLGAKTVTRILTCLPLLVIELVCLALIGAFSQLGRFSEEECGTYYIVSVFGIVTACFLFAAQVLKNVVIFKQAGWCQEKSFQNKKNQTITRPSNMFRLYALLIFIGSMLPISLAFLGKLHPAFYIYVIPLAFGLKISEVLFKKHDNSAEVIQTLKISSLIGFINILIGVIAK
ncbi:MAG: hypothetical protein LBE20_04110 [Deltaproteobacteria bacterium]|jgi:hypothetical protein|nr:hypothetical protein [Deltaproteobacteria bacterium]